MASLKKKKRLTDTENRSGGCQRRQGWSVKRTGWRGSKSKINSLNMINIPQMMKSSHLKTLRRITEYWVLHLEGKKPQKEYLLVSSPTPLFYRWEKWTRKVLRDFPICADLNVKIWTRVFLLVQLLFLIIPCGRTHYKILH